MVDRGDLFLLKKVEKLNPIGDRILGLEDPKSLTKEEFYRSPDLLYHGAIGPFNFDPNFDYESPTYCDNTDGSQTLGAGFYTTPLLQCAENYSCARQGGGVKRRPFVIGVLPYKARVLDLRARGNREENAPVQKEFFEQWKEFYAKWLREINTDQPQYLRDMIEKYRQYLERLSSCQGFNLREMLETAPYPKACSRNLPSPPWAAAFSRFMIGLGYDGLVSVERGEGEWRNVSSPSYVFYNLSKVGTYESWHK